MGEATQILIISIMIATATSIITVLLSMRYLRKDRLWEQQVNAYSRIIRSLHRMKQHCLAGIERAECGDDSFERVKDFCKAVAAVERSVDEGFLFIGPFFAAELAQIRQKLTVCDCAENPEYLRSINLAIDAFLEKVRDIPGLDIGEPY